MAVNTNHTQNKITSSENDLTLDTVGIENNINVSNNRITDLLDPVDNQDAVTKVFLETSIENIETYGDSQTSNLAEVIENIRVNTYVKSVDFSSNNVSGGAGLTATLSTTVVGNANRYTINWGDGVTTTATTDSTPSHVYDNWIGSPFDVNVTAFNESGVGEGSSASKLIENYIEIFTPDPVVTFVAYSQAVGGNQLTYWDDGDTVYFENTTSNTLGMGAVVQYTWNWSDGTPDDIINNETSAGGVNGSRLAHTFAISTESEVQRTVTLTLDSHTTAQQSILPLDDNSSYLLYDTHTPDTSSNIVTGINEESINGLSVIFTNNTESSIGNYSTFGTTYRWDFGDGTITTVNAGTNQSGDTGQTITHKYTLAGNNTAQDFTGNLQVINSHTSSPFTSTDFVIHVEPDVRATIAGSADTISNRSGDNQYDVYDGIDYTGVNRALVTVSNTSEHGDSHVYNWNDSSGNDTEVGLDSVNHDFTGVGAGNYQLDFTVSGTPDITTQTDSANLTFQVNAIPSAPSGLSSKTITLADPAQGHSPKLAHGFTDNSATNPLVAGASLQTSTARRYTNGTLDTSIASNSFNGLAGTVTAIVNGVADGDKTFTTALNENGTFSSLVISDQRDAHNTISTSTYPTGFFQTFDSKITKPFSEYTTGVNDQRIEHSTTGNTNYVTVVCDDHTSVPSNDVSNATLTENVAGSYRYISGIPYYNTGNPQLTLSGVTVNNWIGQAYKDTSNVFEISNGTNSESTYGATISTQYKTYSDLEDIVYLTNNIPAANTLNYQYADQTINITSSNIAAVETLKVRTYNVNGTGNYAHLVEKIQVHTSSPTGILEYAIPVASGLGNGVITDGAIRIADFLSDSTDTPTINSATDYSATPFIGAIDVSGTQEATVRWGKITHNTVDYGTGYLPLGPDRSADTGTQYFTFAFRRRVVANFDVIIAATGISGMWIASPGTQVDNSSGAGGWLDCSIQYAGVGLPGSDTAAGGNGSDGCALTGSDVIQTGTSINSSHTMTLGSENMSNATNNVVLVRVGLTSGQQITNIAIGEAS